MPRLTKSDIERALLTGAAVPWIDASGKPANIQLAMAKQRRLFAYLLNSKIRDVKALSQTFIDGLAAAHVAVGDPAAPSVQQTINPSASGPWMRRPMLNNSSPGQAVYEPFLGSGTTLIAAQSSARICFAIELDPLYVDVAVRRWQAFAGERATLLSTGQTFEQVTSGRAAAPTSPETEQRVEA